MKRIIVDIDSVVLNWEYAFHVWMEQHGHTPIVVDSGLFFKISDQYGLNDDRAINLVRTFNESAAIGFLPPLRDATEYITRLHEQHGYVFHAVTSVGNDPSVVKLREMNLEKLFGAGTFEHVECLPLGSSKRDYLENFAYTNLYFVEDNLRNAEDGLEVGLQPLLMEHGYTLHYNGPIPKVKNWKEVYHIITGRTPFIAGL